MALAICDICNDNYDIGDKILKVDEDSICPDCDEAFEDEDEDDEEVDEEDDEY